MLGTQLKVLAFNPITVVAVLTFAAIVAAWVFVPSEKEQDAAAAPSPTASPITSTSALLRVNGKVVTIRSPKDPSKGFNIRVKEMADGSLRAEVEDEKK